LQIFAAIDKKSDITYADVKKQMKKYASKLNDDLVDDILGEDSDFDYGRQLSEEFIERIGLKELPVALLNGVPLQQSTLTGDEFEETVLTEIMQQTPTIQKAVYKGDLSDSDVVIDYLMNQPHVMIRLNQRILSNEEPTYLDVSGHPHNDVEDINGLAGLSNSDLTATLVANLKYFGGKQTYETFLKNKLHFTSIWIVGDLMVASTKDLLKSALSYMVSF
jgi:UDP-glucose:glycoprotein glucosyltransferase